MKALGASHTRSPDTANRTTTRTEQLTGTYTVDPSHSRVGFEGTAQLNGKDGALNWDPALETGGVLVAEEATLEFEISATEDA